MSTNVPKKFSNDEYAYFGDITKPYGSLTIDDFLTMLKINCGIPGYEYENIGSNVLDGDSSILKQKCHIFTHKMLTFEQMLVSPMNVMDISEVVKIIVGLQPPVPFDDKRFITMDAIADLGNEFSITTTSLFDISHFDGLMSNSLFSITAYSGKEMILESSDYGCTKFKSNWRIRWPMEDPSLPLYIMHEFGGKEIPQIRIVPRVSSTKVSGLKSKINMGDFWVIDSDAEGINIYCDEMLQVSLKKV